MSMKELLKPTVEGIKTEIADRIKLLSHSDKVEVLESLEGWCGFEIGLLEDELNNEESNHEENNV